MSEDKTFDKKARAVKPMNFKVQTQGQVYQHWVAIVPDDMETHELLKPEFYVHVSKNIMDDDLVEVIAEGKQWREFYRVHYIDRPKGEHADPIVHMKLERPRNVSIYDDEKVPDGFDVRWKGPQTKWAVLRSSDNRVLEEKLDTKPQAVAWIKEYLKTMKAA